jgi:serine phosphatase RsbU (regulator of sigma subunit)
VEAHDGHDREFGLDRLIQIVKKHRDEPSQAIAQEVLQKVAKWGREGEDDRTIVVVRATQ